MSSQNFNDDLKDLPLAAEDKKKQASSLKLAPIPTTSPWKSSSPDSNTAIPVEELRDMSKTSKPNKNGSGSIRLTSNTKWTPITPSVTISGSKDTNSKSRKNSKNFKSSKKMKKRGNNNNNINKKDFNGQTNSISEINNASNLESKPFDANAKVKTRLNSGATAGANNKRITSDNNSTNGKQSRYYQNREGKTRYNNEDRSFRHNKAAHNGSPFPSNHHSRPGYISNASHWVNNNSGNSYNQLSYFRPQQYYSNYNYQQQFQTPYYYSMEPIFKSIESIKNQIEFYFSEENLKTDEFLRSKFKKINDGFIPMSLIGKFYRMVNLSLGGDPILILASMREVLQHKETNHLEIAYGNIEGAQTKLADDLNPLHNYFIRRKNWLEYVTEGNFDENDDETGKYNIEKLLEPGDLDNYSYMGYPNFFSSSANGKKSQTFDQGEMSREFEQNLQIND
ncbi:Slf1p [Saccharomyces paradoxus]|uniref:Slf1p n=1 Tax=Saccharomyces paradoxus TaxID=27291 RepID=A0A8B8UPX5_SACPA|nr:Slf1 [Saccharomyces paradoxus]QHS72689.1 Slf1 [Saccharomyces paradoxus]